jgi:transcriptional regulator with XRE-family HTH domain
VGVSPAFASDIELGRRFPSDDMLEKIADVLDCELTTLRKLDTRAPVDDLKRLSEADPTHKRRPKFVKPLPSPAMTRR